MNACVCLDICVRLDKHLLVCLYLCACACVRACVRACVCIRVFMFDLREYSSDYIHLERKPREGDHN